MGIRETIQRLKQINGMRKQIKEKLEEDIEYLKIQTEAIIVAGKEKALNKTIDHYVKTFDFEINNKETGEKVNWRNLKRKEKEELLRDLTEEYIRRHKEEEKRKEKRRKGKRR